MPAFSSTSNPFSLTVSSRFVQRSLQIGALTAAMLLTAQSQAQTNLQSTLDPILAGSWRSDVNKARDVQRHPVQTLTFFGVRPEMTVIELIPGGASAWYAEILAPLLNAKGHYIAANIDPTKFPDPKDSGYYQRTMDALKGKFAAAPAQYSNAQMVAFDLKAPVFGPNNSADMVLTFRNVHNWIRGGEVQGMFRGMFAVLKPGGVLGVVDHRAVAGKPIAEVFASGYLPVESVIAEAQAAGFRLEASSEVNANPKDTKDYAKGVWTLPPVLANKDVDREKYLAIGESDRFTLRFVKPAK